jgi:very-short-patch-repair endonuclease
MNDHPHPGLLPQEKEKRPPAFGGADAPGGRAVFSAEEKEAAISTLTKEFLRRADAVPSPEGEGQDEGGCQTNPHPGPLPSDGRGRIISRARALRKKETWAEKLMWSWLRDRRFSQYKFRRQHPEGIYYLDFFCEEARLAVELDGSGHGFPDQQLHDAKRTAFLTSQGIKVLRFWNSHLRRNAQSIRDTIFNELQERAPHPLPDYTRPMEVAGKGGKN